MKALPTVCVAFMLSAACVAPERESARPEPAPDYTYYRPVARLQPQTSLRRAPAPGAVSQREPSLGRKLRTEKVGGVTFDTETGGIENVVALIRTSTDISVILTPAAREVIASEGLVLELELRAPITVANLLDLITSLSDNLSWRVRHGVVVIGSQAESGSDAVLLTYDVRDLTFQRTSFLPPVIRGIPGEEDLGATPRTGGEAEDKVALVEADQLIDNIKMATDPEYWETDAEASIDYVDSGYLIVKASPEIHRQIRAFLGVGR